MNSELCILLSSCDRYARMAELTARLIDERWEPHPPVFVCGVTRMENQAGGTLLPLREDEKDWIGITLSAVKDLISKGFRKCYLILDDHPPLLACNAGSLNEVLPGLMDRLHAAYIGLYGWDQRTLSMGSDLGADAFHLQHQDPSFLWKYSLHPGLWNLEAFKDILNALPPLDGDGASRSVWAFERRAGGLDSAVPEMWKNASYRIFGQKLLGGLGSFIRYQLRRIEFRILDVIRIITLSLFGKEAHQKLVDSILFEYHFFDGPYPLYWSGVMQKGRFNKDLEKYLRVRGRFKELTRYRAALS